MGRFPDAPLKLRLRLQQGRFRGHEAEYDDTVFRDVLQWFKAAGAFVVILQQEALEPSAAKDIDDRLIAATGVKPALVVAAAQVEAKRDTRMVADHGIIQFDGAMQQMIRIA